MGKIVDWQARRSEVRLELCHYLKNFGHLVSLEQNVGKFSCDVYAKINGQRVCFDVHSKPLLICELIERMYAYRRISAEMVWVLLPEMLLPQFEHPHSSSLRVRKIWMLMQRLQFGFSYLWVKGELKRFRFVNTKYNRDPNDWSGGYYAEYVRLKKMYAYPFEKGQLSF